MNYLLDVFDDHDQFKDSIENRIIDLRLSDDCIDCIAREKINQITFITFTQIIFCTIIPFEEINGLDFENIEEKTILALCNNINNIYVLFNDNKRNSKWMNVYSLESLKNSSKIKSLNDTLRDTIKLKTNTSDKQLSKKYLMTTNDNLLIITDGYDFMTYDIL